MGQKLKFAPIQLRKNNNAIRSHVCNSFTADLAGETKVRFLVLFDDHSSSCQTSKYMQAFRKQFKKIHDYSGKWLMGLIYEKIP